MLPLVADRYLVRLRLTGPARFHFHHGGVLRGLLSRALRTHALPTGLVPFASELGRVRFEPGDPYHLAVTLFGEGRRLAEPLAEGLRRIGADRRSRGGPPPTLGGNFEVEAFEPVPLPAAIDEDRGELAIRFLAPFRLERPAELKQPGAGYLNQHCFPAAHFLSRLWNRVFQVAHGHWPEADDRARMPPIPANADAEPRGLLGLDMPVQGDPAKRRSYTLGGVLGEVALREFPPDWLPILDAGRLTHAGAEPAFGFGAYEILSPDTPAGVPLAGHPLAPSRPLLTLAASEAALERALDHVLADSAAAGVDGITPQELSDRREPALAELAAELRSGRYRPSTLAGWFQRKDDGGLRPLAVPTVRDRAAQRAACEAIGPSIDALLEDCSYAYRKGFSRKGAAWGSASSPTAAPPPAAARSAASKRSRWLPAAPPTRASAGRSMSPAPRPACA